MSVSKTEIEALFEVGSTFNDEPGENALVVCAILEDHLLLKNAATVESDAIVMHYAALSALLELPDNLADTSARSAQSCFAAEYRKRAEQARRDAEVDAMWRSAIVCQIQ